MRVVGENASSLSCCSQSQLTGRRMSARSPRGMSATTAMTTDIWSLPEELLLQLLKGLHTRDLLNMQSTHPYFQDLIKANPSLWTQVGFQDTWPSSPTLRHFERAAEHGNIEALIKLGVAYLYNEGLPGDFEGQKITSNGERAAAMFCRVESLTPSTTPFTWLFIRPPWAVAGACCKECVFNNMKVYVEKNSDPSVRVCIAKTLQLLHSEEESMEVHICRHLRQAAMQGSHTAAYLLWQYKYSQGIQVLDQGRQLERVRDLRDIAVCGSLDAQLALCRQYINGSLGAFSKHQATAFVRDFVQSSKPTSVQDIFKFNELTHSMRYILVDWLVEVASMKDFSSLTLHLAISVVDRYLRIHKTSRSCLQLLGVAAMVLCSRFLGKDIITIREAAWLTDNTYKYEDVVRMMGEICATLQGKFRVITSLDYLELINLAAGSEDVTSTLAEYYCELALLQSDLGAYRQSQVAASCVLLARLTRSEEHPWPTRMLQLTGLTYEDLSVSTLLLHDKCFLARGMVDHRDIVLQAVKQRYSDQDFHCVGNIPILTKEELQDLLGVSEQSHLDNQPASPAMMRPLDLIASPCRPGSSSSKALDRSYSKCELEQEREKAATPSLEHSMTDTSLHTLNESHLSGYDGDREDEGESFLEQDDPGAENLWCVDRPVAPSAVQRLKEEADREAENDGNSFSIKCAKPKDLSPIQAASFITPISSYSKCNFGMSSNFALTTSSSSTSGGGAVRSVNNTLSPATSLGLRYFSPVTSSAVKNSLSEGHKFPVGPLTSGMSLLHGNITDRVRIHIYEDLTSSPSNSVADSGIDLTQQLSLSSNKFDSPSLDSPLTSSLSFCSPASFVAMATTTTASVPVAKSVAEPSSVITSTPSNRTSERIALQNIKNTAFSPKKVHNKRKATQCLANSSKVHIAESHR